MTGVSAGGPICGAIGTSAIGSFTTTCCGLWIGLTVKMFIGELIGKLVAVVEGLVTKAGLDEKTGNDGADVVDTVTPFNGAVFGTMTSIGISTGIVIGFGTPVGLPIPLAGLEVTVWERTGGNKEFLSVVGNFVNGDIVGLSTNVGELSGDTVETVGALNKFGALDTTVGISLTAGLLVVVALG